MLGANGIVAIRGARQRTLLALLLVNAAETMTKDQLCDGLWGDNVPINVDNALQASVMRLRGTLKENFGEQDVACRLLTRPTGYCFDVDKCEVDAHVFESLVNKAQAEMRTDQAYALSLLERALALWKGPPLQGVIDGAISRSATLRLEDRRLSALEDRFLLATSRGVSSSVISELKAAAHMHPWRERIIELLMISLYRVGRQVEAVQVYNQVRNQLVEELGMEPSPLLQARLRAILKGAPQ
ncbi:MAG: winged helix-turn-helix domain-containing protein [Pseudonocardiales bacterium]|nr:winged helix-turn-helix domain-containing protein [Pseudonocardiales bacterium]